MAFFSRGKVTLKMADHGLDDLNSIESLFLLGYIGLKDLLVRILKIPKIFIRK